ncbi:uncharacterized protein LOC124929312 isoform X2 [Impatiens glandulifera]|uniref:uncharacterized protein LOC124929312 isoform X2 n=1 Tax=Impatiens glandulifera TaxID=253017 RepID=UPI001FB09CAA|nr:uncharacterized protein LOC124929312 isoform X2 [Impatiens glandulifera]
MEYDFRNTATPYEPQSLRPATSSSASSAHPMYGPSTHYPRIGQSGHSLQQPTNARTSSVHHNSSSPASGLGIRVALKQEYRITPPPQLFPKFGDIPRSTFQFDFDLERKILAELEKETQNWSKLGLENISSNNNTAATSSMGSVTDNPVISKYIASGLSREAVPFAVAHYGDNPTKVKEFVNGYTLLREMGFSSKNVSEVLIMYENDTDKALAHFLNGSS